LEFLGKMSTPCAGPISCIKIQKQIVSEKMKIFVESLHSIKSPIQYDFGGE
jgi:hypothetical protein